MDGYHFTWSSGKGTVDAVKERIDGALVSSDWLNFFPLAKLSNLMASISDHSPIFLTLIPRVQQKRSRLFKFENSWLQEYSLWDTVVESWNSLLQGSFVDKVERCTADLESWARKLRQNCRL